MKTPPGSQGTTKRHLSKPSVRLRNDAQGWSLNTSLEAAYLHHRPLRTNPPSHTHWMQQVHCRHVQQKNPIECLLKPREYSLVSHRGVFTRQGCARNAPVLAPEAWPLDCTGSSEQAPRPWLRGPARDTWDAWHGHARDRRAWPLGLYPPAEHCGQRPGGPCLGLGGAPRALSPTPQAVPHEQCTHTCRTAPEKKAGARHMKTPCGWRRPKRGESRRETAFYCL